MEHSSEQPHLIHSVNVTQVEMVLDGLSTSDKFKPRFAVGLSIATNDPESSPLQVDHSRSLDDEHSPGVFTVSLLYFTVYKSLLGPFLQWLVMIITGRLTCS